MYRLTAISIQVLLYISMIRAVQADGTIHRQDVHCYVCVLQRGQLLLAAAAAHQMALHCAQTSAVLLMKHA